MYEVFRSLEDDRTSVQWRHCVHAVLLEAPLPVKSAADRPNASTASNCTMPWIMELVWRFSDTVSSAICWSLVPAPPGTPDSRRRLQASTKEVVSDSNKGGVTSTDSLCKCRAVLNWRNHVRTASTYVLLCRAPYVLLCRASQQYRPAAHGRPRPGRTPRQRS